MINKELINPRSIVIIGGSEDTSKPGGKLIRNLKDGKFKGALYVVNPRSFGKIQNIPTFNNISDLPNIDLAILSVQAENCIGYIKDLINKKGTKAFIIISAGFGEVNANGKQNEKEILELINENNCTLIGPNCIGVSTRYYTGVFTGSVPEYSIKGCDLISGSGAMAVFVIEQGLLQGLKFANVFSVGNAIQVTAEDLLEHLDQTFDPVTDSPIKLLYLESIQNPQKFLFHSRSLTQKGAKIIAIKSGSTEPGKLAAVSHTGAISSSDIAVDCLFDKAGIIRCNSRFELIYIASILSEKPLKGKRFALITHAGGPAVLLTDNLSKSGFIIPVETSENNKLLCEKLLPGSSAINPFDILATGKEHELEIVLDHCIISNQYDGIIVILGSPGLANEIPMFKLVAEKKAQSSKPIYLVIPSPINAKIETDFFTQQGYSFFSDEVLLSHVLKSIWGKAGGSIQPITYQQKEARFSETARDIIKNSGNGFINYDKAIELLRAVQIDVPGQIIKDKESLVTALEEMKFPLVLKRTGHFHKTETSAVFLNLYNKERVIEAYEKIIKNGGEPEMILQPMYSGFELFIGIMFEKNYGHILFVGQGGIYIEINNDISCALLPISAEKCRSMIQNLKCYPIISGLRGIKDADENELVEFMLKISNLTLHVPEIIEMDINPLISSEGKLYPVDVRIKINH